VRIFVSFDEIKGLVLTGEAQKPEKWMPLMDAGNCLLGS
jgi:hypothetical protein